MIANGRIYNLDISQVNGKTKIQSRLGRIHSIDMLLVQDHKLWVTLV